MFLEKPFSGNEVDFSAVKQLLKLAFNFCKNFKESPFAAFGNTMCLADRQIFPAHVLNNAAVGRLAVLVQAVTGQHGWDVADLTALLAKTQNKIDIATV